MKLLRLFVVALALALPLRASSQSMTEHAPAADRLINAALKDSASYKRLSTLVDRFGHRMSGSASLERAIDWIVGEMKRDGLENVHTEPVMITHWVRGTESAVMESPRRLPLRMLGLGRSVGTPAGGIAAPVLVVRNFAELRARAAQAKGKIVLFNFPFDPAVHPFIGYGDAVQYRAYGADSAANLGALAVLVRSVTPHSLSSPHTGAMSYADSARTVPKIPGAAITVEDAELLQRLQDAGERITVRLTMGARTLAPAPSRNVVAEIRGSEKPDEIVVIGGHIDSWDVGQGAMDDAGGSVAAWEALRLIKQSGVRPKRTIRVVLWTNEEIGLGGAFAYRDAHAAQLSKHVLAMESDNGVFRPRGLVFSGDSSGLPMIREIGSLLKRVGVDSVQIAGPEADVWPLNERGVPTVAIDTDPTKYFWYHHTDADTIDKLDPRELSMCVAVMAVIANTAANMEGRLPGPRPAAVSTTSGGWLYAWASSGDTTRRGAFLAQLDLREGSPTAGKVVRVIPAGAGSYSTHHSEHSLPSDGLFFADDFGLGASYVFDLNDPSNPRLKTSFTTAGPFGWPHSYVRLPSGNRLVTYQWQKTKFNQPPGGLAEVSSDGKVIRWASATTAGVDDKDITPYSLEVIPALDRVVSTSTSMIENTGVGIQIWRLSDLKLLHTLRIPSEHAHGGHAADTASHHLFPGEPRILSDGKTVMFATFTCGLYALTGVETSAPKVTPVYTFEGQDCAVPVVTGKYWLQTEPATHSVVALDISNPLAPREVSRVQLGEEGRPHWLAIDGSGRRLVVDNGSRRDTKLFLVDFDPATGALTRNVALPVLDLSSVTVPGLGVVKGIPHGAVFSH